MPGIGEEWMPTTNDAVAQGITWDLSDLYGAYDDPQIAADVERLRSEAAAFADTYRGTVDVEGGPAAALLLAAVTALEELHERSGRLQAYAGLLYSADTGRDEHRDLEQRTEQQLTEIQNLVLFFDLEWSRVDEATAQALLDDPQLATHRHYLEQVRKYRPHLLSEPEEQIVNEKDLTGPLAWARLHTEITSSLTFSVERDGTQRDHTLDEVLALFHHPDRNLRRRAHDALYAVLEGQGAVLTYVYDTLIQDHLNMDRLRDYPDAMAQRHLSNEVDPAAVAAMMEVTEANYGLAQAYFELKRRLLQLPELRLYDQYAPVGNVDREYPFSDAREMVLESYEAFDPQFRDIALRFFDGRWIDADPRPGKRGGAFCWSPSPQTHPYVLCNYTGTFRDVMTVAHELGHGVHGWLAREQTLLNYHPTLPLAETASVFGEIAVFDRLVASEQDPATALALTCAKVEDIFATVFRQNVLTRFEQTAYAARGDGRLTSDRLSDLWIEANGKYYGDAVQLTEGYRWGWSYIPHFIHTRFYCYAYTFAELLVLALYSLYREQGRAFVPRFLDLLRSGGCDSPAALLAPLGVDYRDPAFWEHGFAELRRLITRAEELAATAGV